MSNRTNLKKDKSEPCRRIFSNRTNLKNDNYERNKWGKAKTEEGESVKEYFGKGKICKIIILERSNLKKDSFEKE